MRRDRGSNGLTHREHALHDDGRSRSPTPAFSSLVQIINNETGAVMQTINGDTEPVTSLAWGPRMESMLVASRSLQVRSFSVETGRVLKTFRGHRAPVAHMAVDGSETLMATASADKLVKVWDIEGGYCTHSFSGHRYADE